MSGVLVSPAIGLGVTLYSPTVDGAARQPIMTDGSGNLYFGSVAYADVTGTPSLGTSSVVDIGTSGDKVPLLSGTNTWSGPQTVRRDNIVSTPTAAVVLENATVTTSGVTSQFSPALDLTGRHWSGSADAYTTWRVYNVPSGGSSASTLTFASGYNGTAPAQRMQLTSAGQLTVSTMIVSSGGTNITGNNTLSGFINDTYNQGASQGVFQHTGTLRSGGSGTDTFPIFFHQPTGTTAATTYSTGGTIFGANAASGFGGNFFDFRIAGSTSLGSLSSGGTLTTLALVANTLNTNGNITLASNQVLIWTSRGRITSPASDTIQFGNVDGASPTAQTLSVQSVITGTSNTAGVLWTFKDSAGTGTGASGGYAWQTASAGSTGSTQNTYSTKMALSSAGVLTVGGLSINPGNGFVTLDQTFQIYIRTANALKLQTGSSDFVMIQNTSNTSGLLFCNSSNVADTGLARIATSQLRFANSGVTSGFVLSSVTDNTCTVLNRAGNAAGGLSSDSLITSDPTSGTGPAWKLGTVKAATVTLDTANYAEAMIGGSLKKIALVV